ncbi:MAG: hypothetical protein CVT94_18970 [Bacteroidetes bacterium HGW-Bacteroidetes-11]|nr:MAG: hypothetical protein CVT94_18970 [Bacteroidetes bacterium HGW-Bacteroidetes-11]
MRLTFLATLLFFFIVVFGQHNNNTPKVRKSSNKQQIDSALVLKFLKTAVSLELNDPAKSLEFAERAKNMAQSIRYDSAEVKALELMGSNYSRLMRLNEAIETGEKVIETATRYGFELDIAFGREIIAVAYAQGGDFDRSSKLYFENLKLYEKLKEKRLLGRTLGNIGADFIEQRNYKKAVEYTNKALEIGLQTENWTLVSDQYNNLAAIYQVGFPDTEKALHYYTLALQVAIQIGDLQQQGINMLNMGRFLGELKQFDSAFIYLNKSLAIFKALNNPIYTGDCYTAMGNCHYLNGDNAEAKRYALLSLEIGNKYGIIQTIYFASGLLHRLSIAVGDSAEAYKYHYIEAKTMDSLKSLQGNNELFKLEFQYNQEKIIKEQKIKQIRNYFILGIIILILMSGMAIVLLFYSRQRIKIKNAILEKDKAESILKFKSKELSINLMALLKKNELISEISQKIALLQDADSESDIKEAARKINSEIKQNSDDRLWHEFSLRFSETNREFYEKLLALFPDLTPSELKLCAYLRLNMSTKEISDLTGQRTETLEKARYRLRKKFSINNSENNLITFLTQI